MTDDLETTWQAERDRAGTTTDPRLTQLAELHRLAEHNAHLALSAAQNRNRAIVAAVAGGVSVRQVARTLDLSESRVHTIIKRDGVN